LKNLDYKLFLLKLFLYLIRFASQELSSQSNINAAINILLRLYQKINYLCGSIFLKLCHLAATGTVERTTPKNQEATQIASAGIKDHLLTPQEILNLVDQTRTANSTNSTNQDHAITNSKEEIAMTSSIARIETTNSKDLTEIINSTVRAEMAISTDLLATIDMTAQAETVISTDLLATTNLTAQVETENLKDRAEITSLIDRLEIINSIDLLETINLTDHLVMASLASHQATVNSGNLDLATTIKAMAIDAHLEDSKMVTKIETSAIVEMTAETTVTMEEQEDLLLLTENSKQMLTTTD